MCLIFNHEIDKLPLINKIIGKRTLTEAQLILSKMGGKVTQSDLKNMSLEHFICLCSMNQIQVKFK